MIAVALTEWFVYMRECRERASGASSIQHNSEITDEQVERGTDEQVGKFQA